MLDLELRIDDLERQVAFQQDLRARDQQGHNKAVEELATRIEKHLSTIEALLKDKQ